jgi:NYN domain
MVSMLPAILASARIGGLLVLRDPTRAERVVVFIDGQNAYMGAREEFGQLVSPSRFGQADPLALGRLITRRRRRPSRLAGVRVYRGLPDVSCQPQAHAAARRQVEAQIERGAGLVTVVTRPLRYPRGWPSAPAEEKGIDVSLAVDLVATAATGRFDVAVLMSTDTDLPPALEAAAIFAGRPYPRCELAGRREPGQSHRRLVPKGRRLCCHWLCRDDVEAVRDDTDYNVGTP